MSATNAHSTRVSSLSQVPAITHIANDTKDGIGPGAERQGWPVNSDTSMIESHHSGAASPITFVDELPVNGRTLRIPMAERQPGHASIIQCVARLARSSGGGFHTFGVGPLIRARIQFNAIRDVYSARLHVMQLRNQLIGLANTMSPALVAGGGGCKDIEAHVRQTSGAGPHLDIDMIVDIPNRSDVQIVDIMIHKMAPLIEQLTHGARGSASISEIADRQLLCAQVTLDAGSFSLAPAPASALAGRVVELHNFTCTAAERVSARNAEILAAANSVLGALDSAGDGAEHERRAWTAHSDHGAPLAIWYRDHHGHLAGRIALPLLARQTDHNPAAAGSVGRFGPGTVQHAHLLNHAVAAIALAQSLAGLHAHATEAIARSNPAQHAYDLALMVGARGVEVDKLVSTMTCAPNIRCDHAVAALAAIRAR